jgi:hypothetical protein
MANYATRTALRAIGVDFSQISHGKSISSQTISRQRQAATNNYASLAEACSAGFAVVLL